jgi:hypothetical protein
VFSSGGIPAFNQSFECLDLRRNPGPEYKKLLVEKMRLQYGHRKPDLIIAVNPIAMRFATDDCRDVFANIPILALMLPTDFQVPKTSGRVISHFPSLDIVDTLDIALKLVPLRSASMSPAEAMKPTLRSKTRFDGFRRNGKVACSLST